MFPLKIAICDSPCGTNKQCTGLGTCTCASGWTDSNCSTGIFYNIDMIN